MSYQALLGQESLKHLAVLLSTIIKIVTQWHSFLPKEVSFYHIKASPFMTGPDLSKVMVKNWCLTVQCLLHAVFFSLNKMLQHGGEGFWSSSTDVLFKVLAVYSLLKLLYSLNCYDHSWIFKLMYWF